MTLQTRPNQSFALVCDQKGCNNEILGPTVDDVRDDASLVRWEVDTNDECKCLQCRRGRHQSVQGQMLINAPADLKAGERVLQSGQAIGWAVHDAKAGEMIELSNTPPTPPQQFGHSGTGIPQGAQPPPEADGEDFFLDVDLDSAEVPQLPKPRTPEEAAADRMIADLSDDNIFGEWDK